MAVCGLVASVWIDGVIYGFRAWWQDDVAGCSFGLVVGFSGLILVSGLLLLVRVSRDLRFCVVDLTCGGWFI